MLGISLGMELKQRGSGVPTSAFYAPLTKSLVLSRGTGSPTFTRATTAYVKDFEDVWRQVPSGAARFEGARVVRNRVSTKSEDFSHASWAVVGTCSKVGNTTITGPAGTSITAMEVAFGANPDSFIYNSMTSVGAAGTVTASVWVRAVSGSTTIRMSASNVLTSAITVDTTWKRISATETGVGTTFAAAYNNAAGNSGNVYLYAAQNEDVTGQSNQNPSEYVSVGVLSAPYHGAGVDGIKYFATENGNSVASNVVTEATGAAIPDATLKGYFAEGQRQNRCLYSQDFSNAAWVSGGGGIAVTPNTAVAPDGTTTADTLTASGANGTLIQDLGVVASAAKAGGLYLKRKTGTGNIDLTLDGGSTWTTVAVTSSWLLLEKTQTLADEDFGIRIVTSGDEVYAWTAQVETAAFISSPIPTTTAAVTRNTDSLQYIAGNLVTTADYSMYCEIYAPQPAAKLVGKNYYMVGKDNYQPMWCIDGGGGGGDARFFSNNGGNSSNVTFSDAARLNMAKFGCYKTSTQIQNVLNGTAGTAVALGTQVGSSSTVGIGINQSSATLDGCIRNVRFWTKALSDAQLMSMTA